MQTIPNFQLPNYCNKMRDKGLDYKQATTLLRIGHKWHWIPTIPTFHLWNRSGLSISAGAKSWLAGQIQHSQKTLTIPWGSLLSSSPIYPKHCCCHEHFVCPTGSAPRFPGRCSWLGQHFGGDQISDFDSTLGNCKPCSYHGQVFWHAAVPFLEAADLYKSQNFCVYRL